MVSEGIAGKDGRSSVSAGIGAGWHRGSALCADGDRSVGHELSSRFGVMGGSAASSTMRPPQHGQMVNDRPVSCR